VCVVDVLFKPFVWVGMNTVRIHHAITKKLAQCTHTSTHAVMLWQWYIHIYIHADGTAAL
jgi:hypothetical protein